MKNTTIKQIAFTAVMGLFLNACGGGGGGGGGETPPPVVSENKVPECGNEEDLGKSVAEDVTGKTITKVSDEADVRIWHSPDGTKLACMKTGEANIVDK